MPERFRMPIKDKFYITGRGVVVTGTVTQGVLQTGNTVTVKQSSGDIETVATGIERFINALGKPAIAGDTIGVLLRAPKSKDEIEEGAVLVGEVPEQF